MGSQRRLIKKSSQKLYGREEEMEQLQQVLVRATEVGSHTQIVLVKGSSGTGKSRLLEHATVHSQHVIPFVYGAGKFEHESSHHHHHHNNNNNNNKNNNNNNNAATNSSCRPYEALISSFSAIIGQVTLRQDEFSERIQDHLNPEEWALLTNLIPAFRLLDDVHATTTTTKTTIDGHPSSGKEEKYSSSSSSSSISISMEENNVTGIEKLKYVLKLVLAAIATPELPVVIVLDDIQWIDKATLMILKSLLISSEITNLVLFASYRDNEVHEQHILIPWLEEFKSSITTITTRDLTVSCLEMLLTDVLHDTRVEDLALLVYKRTHGNAFHVWQLLDYLQSEQLLQCSPGGCWKWDIVELRGRTSVTDNVVDVVVARIQRLPQPILRKLKLFSCLGYHFEISVLSHLQNVMINDEDDEDVSLEESLNFIIEEGLLERLDNDRIQFAHDKILQASCQVLELELNRAKLNFDIGFELWKTEGFSNTNIQFLQQTAASPIVTRLFLCADQLIMGSAFVEGLEFRLEVARLLCVAAKLTATFSAFLPAISYTKAAITFIDPTTCWNGSNYHLTLELHILLSEYCVYMGHLDVHKEAVLEVLINARSLKDRTRVSLSRIQGLIAEAKFIDVISTSLQFLKELGEDIPENPSAFYKRRTMNKAKSRLEKLRASGSKDGVLSLPKATDFRKTLAIQVLSDAVTSALQLGKHNLTAVFISRMILLTLKHGLAPYSSLGFALAAQLFAYDRMEIAFADEMSKLALTMAQSVPSNQTLAGVMLYSYNNFHWREALAKVTDCYFDTYRVGMQNGDLHSAFQAIIGYSFSYFYSGLPLEPLLADLTKFNGLMLEYGHKFFLLINIPVHQCVLNLTGQSTDILDLNRGTAAAFREKVGWESRAGEQIQWAYTMQVAVYCESLELATSMYELLESTSAGIAKSVAFYPTRVFFFAIIAVWNFKVSKQRKWMKEARKHTSIIRGWVLKHGAVNLVHKHNILEAEFASLDQNVKHTDLVNLYDQAISLSAKLGFLQDAALAAHLASRAVKDARVSRDYFRAAADYYLRWGAKGITRDLNTRIRYHRSPSLVMPDESECVRPGLRGRERFDVSVTQLHKIGHSDRFLLDSSRQDRSSEPFQVESN